MLYFTDVNRGRYPEGGLNTSRCGTADGVKNKLGKNYKGLNAENEKIRSL